MKKIYLPVCTILCTILFSFIFLSEAESQPNNNHKLSALTIKAEVVKEPAPQIKISWEKHPSAVAYEIRRKNLTDASFPNQALAQIDTSLTFFVDDNVQVGQDYEYDVRAIYLAKQSFRFSDGQGGSKDSVLTMYFMATGYVYTGIEADVKSKYDKCLLLIDENIYDALPGEITRLQEDLIKEGWQLVSKLVPRTEEFDPDAVKYVKDIIIAEAAKDTDKEMYVFLLGRIAVAYSGQIYPDGHGNHIGAWPCDGYFGSLNENAWTDYSINNVTASREENKNIPGDGKFDQSTFQYNPVDLPIGRVDFFNMPTFEKSEVELLKQYLDKDHLYRTGEMPYINRGLIDENFGVSINACASSAWRSFSLFFGVDSVKNKSMGMDWFTNLSTDNYLWAYGCGGGSYNKANGIGYSEDFDTLNVNAVFTMLFGSYFGDWDSKNNFLRAGLASEPSVLTCSWSGFPQQYYHHMGLGLPIGHSIKISQNNIYNYVGYAYLNANQWRLNGQGLGQIHVALMGDPTLRMYMGKIPEPANLSIVQLPKFQVELTWNAPEGEGEYKFNVYRSDNYNGPYEKVNTESISESSFIDSNLIFGPVYYMVRTEMIETTNSGSFKNLSRAIIQNINVTDVEDNNNLITSVSCYPNPAIKEINIAITLENLSNTKIEIFNSRGNLVKVFDYGIMARGEQKLSWNLIDRNGMSIPSGVFYIRVSANDKVRVEKFTVIR